jgi:hypothetical protein
MMQLMILLRLNGPQGPADMEDVMLARTLAALILAATLVATPGIAEAGAVRDKLHEIKQRIKLDVKDIKCLLKKGPCTFF